MKIYSRQPKDGLLIRIQRQPKPLILLCFFVVVSISVPASAKAEAGKKRGPAQARPEAVPVAQALAKEEAGKADEAVKLLSQIVGKETNPEKRALARLAKAGVLDRSGRFSEADAEYTAAIADGLRVADYAYFYRGVLRKKQGMLKEAKLDFEKVVESRAPNDTIIDARMDLADIDLGQKDWKGALKHLNPIRKHTRSHPRYPDVLYGLFIAEKKSGARGGGCKWARELYAKFPSSPLVKNWGPVLAQDTIDNEKTGCSSTTSDLRTRVRRLQLAGEAQRASDELRSLKGKSAEGAVSSDVDTILANHLVSEGHVDEAMKLLLKHYEAEKSHPAYLMLLGKAASRAGEYQSSIGAFQRAYDLAPKSKDAATALFQAGFTGYQIQDYDGATRRFEKLTSAFPRSAYSRDAKWYLAWIRYLRGDYEGALDSFKGLAKAPKVRRGRHAKPVDALASDRLRYWSAMSLLKLGRNQDAIPILQSLVRDPAIGYYSVLSFYRLLEVPGAKLPAGIETRLGLKKTEAGPQAAPTEEELKAAAEAVETAAADDAAADEDDSMETTEADAAEAGGADATETAAADNETEGTFQNASLAQRFERARDLEQVGLLGDARRELGEIERKARKAEDRKLLMIEYANVQNYNRSSTIGDLGFSQQRLRSGLRGEGRVLWEYAYPRAWENSVREVAKSTNVPEELIWGIMRAESQYRTEVQSPVGAMGLMQIMPFTGRQLANLVSMNTFETRSLLEPAVNIRLGTRYLQRLLEKFSGSVPLVAAGYNAGPHRVHAWVRGFGSLEMDEFIEHIPYLETRNYVKKVVRNFQIYSLLYSGGTHSLRWLVQPVGVELDERIPTSEVW